MSSIVFDEYEWARQKIEERDLGNKPMETLNRVAKSYLKDGYNKREIREMLDKFMVQCDPNVSLVRWSDSLDKVVKNVDKYPLIQIDNIPVSKNELSNIKKLGSKQIRRLAFTLLCTAKYWDAVSERNDHWVNTQDKDIMRIANINTSIRRQSLMFSDLRNAGLIRFSRKVDNLNVQVLFIEPGEEAMRIQDFQDLGYRYLMYCGEPFYECVNCGAITKMQAPPRGRHPKYCPCCAAEIHTKQKINSIMRHREPDVKNMQKM